ncbi:hypothetical protein [Salinigranum sp.]|uniref:hypothetical protein n=1 Tax=Salinigranum sp. TaxID=1966351 RepID=UPI003563F4B9
MTETPTDESAETPEPTDDTTETSEPTDESAETAEPTDESAETAEPIDHAAETPEPTGTPGSADDATETPESTETSEPTRTPEPTDDATETPEPTEAPEPTDDATETPDGDADAAPASADDGTANRSEEYVADWAISNEGTVDADRLLLTRLTVEVRGLNGSTRKEALRSARVTFAAYEGDDVSGFPGTLWALARKLEETDIELDSGADGPELPADEAAVRTFELGVQFDYSSLSGVGGYSIAASPEFTIEQY